LGSTGYQPVPSGNLPDGTGAGINEQLWRWLHCNTRSHCGRQVADRGGQVARATHFSDRLEKQKTFKLRQSENEGIQRFPSAHADESGLILLFDGEVGR
jgi:hypothetical protein